MMPELPEVETVRRGIAPHVIGQTVDTGHRAAIPVALAGA